MSKIPAVFAAFFLAASALGAGCAVDSQVDEADAEETSTSQDELSRYASALVGAYHGDDNRRTPTFGGIVFAENGTFFADVDTGIRCVRAPCPSNVRLEGRYTATKTYVRLRPKTGETSHEYHGSYRYTKQGSKLVLYRSAWNDWTQSFAKEISYCSAATDCNAQNLIHPMCLGQWTCGDTNQCAWKCGVLPSNDVWPSDATKVVADSPGGGFTPPAPPGSTCAWGKQRYSLTVSTKSLSWERCEQSAAGPLTLVTGTRRLTATEYAGVEKALDAVVVSKQEICGADKPMLTLTVSTPRGDTKYTDDFYSCFGKGPFVDNIDGVFGALRPLAK